MADEQTETTEIVWDAITIEVSLTKNWLNSTTHHIQLRANEPLSVTTTGYLSHFIQAEADMDIRIAADLVLAWLEYAALSREWQDHVEQRKQGDLFDL